VLYQLSYPGGLASRAECW